jgi:branched-chain amino acid transport system substrate-binding protein
MHVVTTTSSRRRGRRIGVALVAALALVAAACGDDSSSEDTTPAPAETTAAPTTAAPTTAAPETSVETTAAPTTAAPTTAAPTTTAKTTASTAAATTKATTTTTKSTTTTTTTVATTTTIGKPTKSQIVIGAAIGTSGSNGAAQIAGAYAAQAWESWVNEEMGGINGHPVKVVIKDVKGDPATALAVSKDLVDNDKIIAAVGSADSATETQWSKPFIDAKVPVIGGNCYLNAVCNGQVGFFQISTSLPAVSQVQVIAGKAIGATKMGRISTGTVAVSQAADGIYKPVADNVSLAFIGSTPIDPANPSFAATCLLQKSSGVDYVQLSLAASVAFRVIADCKAQDYAPAWGASGGSFDEDLLGPLTNNGAVFTGGINAFPWWVNTAPVKQFRDVMAKYAAGKAYRNPSSTGTWAALELFRKVMANASANPTKEEVMAAMFNVKNETLGGLLPKPLTFTAGQTSPLIPCYWLYKMEKGQVIGSADPTCYP